MAEKIKEQRDYHEESSTFFGRSLLTGFVGGILASIVGIFMYYFNFMEVAAKSYLLRSWTTAGWTDTWLGEIVTILVIGLISIGIALIYLGLMKKNKSMWMGIVYGLILWAIVFFVLQPVFQNVPQLSEMETKTIVSTLCLFILYGTFIGYSISYDYHDTVVGPREEMKEESDK